MADGFEPCPECGTEGRIYIANGNDPYPRDAGECQCCNGNGMVFVGDETVNTETSDGAIYAFVSERDEVLLSLDLDRVMAFHDKYNPDLPMTREVAEVAMHKARSALRNHPEAQAVSIAWLKERGYRHFGDMS